MAKIILNGVAASVPDGAAVGPACEAAGLAFNCHTGVCGSCLIDVLDGTENLTPLTDEENVLGLSPVRRLACQCRILKGTVTVGF